MKEKEKEKDNGEEKDKKVEEEENSDNKVAFKTFVDIVCGENKKSQIFTVKGKEITCWFIEREITFTPESFEMRP